MPTSSYKITVAGHHTLCYRAVDRAGHPSRAGNLTLFIEGENKVYLPLIFERDRR